LCCKIIKSGFEIMLKEIFLKKDQIVGKIEKAKTTYYFIYIFFQEEWKRQQAESIKKQSSKKGKISFPRIARSHVTKVSQSKLNF
jgi:hypothetical protein